MRQRNFKWCVGRPLIKLDPGLPVKKIAGGPLEFIDISKNMVILAEILKAWLNLTINV